LRDEVCITNRSNRAVNRTDKHGGSQEGGKGGLEEKEEGIKVDTWKLLGLLGATNAVLLCKTPYLAL